MRSPTTFPRVRPAGDCAFTLELGDDVSVELNARVHGLDAAIAAARLPGVIETVPTYRSVLVMVDPDRIEAEALPIELAALARQARPRPSGGELWTLPVSFAPEHGVDLAHVAGALRMSERMVAERFAAADYTVYMLGFAPGFAYLGGLPTELAVSRRAEPRLAVPGGSVMVGGVQAAIMPQTMPSGWHALARTPVRLFDPARSHPFMLGPGDRVRFAAISTAEFASLERSAAQGWIPEPKR